MPAFEEFHPRITVSENRCVQEEILKQNDKASDNYGFGGGRGKSIIA